MTENETPDFFEERDTFGLIKPKVKIQEENNDPNKGDTENDLEYEYAGLGLRILAYILDTIILLVPIIIFSLAFWGARWASPENSVKQDLLSLLIWTLYYGAAESSNSQATIGKKICGIKVIDENGNKLTFTKAVFRYLAIIISILPLGFGIWTIVSKNNPKKQAWHDMLLGCLVIVNRRNNIV